MKNPHHTKAGPGRRHSEGEGRKGFGHLSGFSGAKLLRKMKQGTLTKRG